MTSGACGTVYTSSVLITVYDDLVAGAIGSAQTICYNTSPAGLTDDTSPTEEPVLMHINGKARQITQLGVIYQELLRQPTLLGR